MPRYTFSSWGQLLGSHPESDKGSVGTDERRLGVRFVCDLQAACQPMDDPASPRLAAHVRNISRGGISLVVRQPFTSGAILRVELPGATGPCTRALLACVIHANEQPDGDWALGCTFVTELSDADLEPFGGERLRATTSDNRTWQRFPCDAQASFRKVRITERNRTPAQVTDISARGVGLLVHSPVDVGTVLQLDLEGGKAPARMRLLACVVHVVARADNEWAIGCNFMREISTKELNALL